VNKYTIILDPSHQKEIYYYAKLVWSHLTSRAKTLLIVNKQAASAEKYSELD